MSQTQTPDTRQDSWVNESDPNTNYAEATGLKLSGDTDARKRAYLWFPLPFKAGDTVIEATLTLEPLSGFGGGSDSFTAARVIDPWKARKITWNDQPDVHANDQASASSNGETLSFDITGMLAAVANGGAWFGVRITTGATGIRRVHSANHPTHASRPRLTVTWARTPDPPTNLRPSGENVVSDSRPTILWAFTDQKGREIQQAFQVLADTSDAVDSNGVLSSPSFDSGQVTSDEEMLDLSTTAFSAMSSGDQRWWQVRAQNESGIWSDYSDLESFYYIPLPDLTLDNPVNEGTVEETTPPVAWTYSGEQYSSNVWLFEGDPDQGYGEGYGEAYGGATYLLEWEMGRRSGADDTVTIPPGHIRFDDENRYKVRVRVWDGYLRQGLPGAPTYAEDEAVFTFAKSATPTAPTGLTVEEDDDRLVMEWTRASMPDYWSIQVDNELVADRIDGEDPFVSGTTYRYRIKNAKPGRTADYSVMAVVKDGGVYKHSLHTAALVTHTFQPLGIWLRQLHTDEVIQLLDTQEIPLQPGVESSLLYPIATNANPRPLPVRITDSVRGYETTASGIIVGATAHNTFQRFLGNPPETQYLYTAVNHQLIVELGDFTGPAPIDGKIDGELAWQVSAQVTEVDSFAFRIRG